MNNKEKTEFDSKRNPVPKRVKRDNTHDDDGDMVFDDFSDFAPESDHESDEYCFFRSKNLSPYKLTADGCEVEVTSEDGEAPSANDAPAVNPQCPETQEEIN